MRFIVFGALYIEAESRPMAYIAAMEWGRSAVTYKSGNGWSVRHIFSLPPSFHLQYTGSGVFDEEKIKYKFLGGFGIKRSYIDLEK